MVLPLLRLLASQWVVLKVAVSLLASPVDHSIGGQAAGSAACPLCYNPQWRFITSDKIPCSIKVRLTNASSGSAWPILIRAMMQRVRMTEAPSPVCVSRPLTGCEARCEQKERVRR